MRVFRLDCAGAAVLAAALLIAPAPSNGETTAPKASAPKSATAKAAPAKSIRWRAIAAGEAEAQKKGKPALYFFTAEWCGPCHLLQAEVFSVPEVAAQVEKDYVPIAVEDRARETGRNAPEMIALADRYGLRGFPTLVVSRPKLATNITLEGWEGRKLAIEFLATGRKQFLDLEKKAGVKK